MNIKYVVELSEEEQDKLRVLTTKGSTGARVLKRANLLRMSDKGLPDNEIVELLGVSTSTIGRTKKGLLKMG